jgi:hypothetical protein
MIKYNSEVNLLKIKEKDILQEINKRKKELCNYGMTDKEIEKVIKCNCYDIDLCSYDAKIILLNISICELLWYNKVYNDYHKYKNSLQKTSYLNNDVRLNVVEEKMHKNNFLSTMALIIQKYGNELLDNL